MKAKPDNRTKSGLFKKGVSGNPGGRPKIPDWFKDHSEEAQKRLLYWMKSKNAKASMQAASLILAYSLGKPTEHVAHSGTITLEDLLSRVNP